MAAQANFPAASDCSIGTHFTDEDRAAAQSWFSEPTRRSISGRHDARVTAATRELSLAMLMARYRQVHGRRPRTFLDVGCGDGRTLELVGQRYPDVIVTGTDPVIEAVRAARARVPGGTVIRTAGAPAGEFDAVFAHLCVGLWSRPIESMVNITEQLSESGMLYVVDISAEDRNSGPRLAESEEERRYLADQYSAAFDSSQFGDLFDQVVRRSAQPGLRLHTGTRTFGGYEFGSSEQLAMLADGHVISALKSFGTASAASGTFIPALLHGWLWREAPSSD